MLMAKGSKQAAGQKSLFAGDTPRMPDGYYSGDLPNTNLRRFVEERLREHPFDPESDDYSIEAFDVPFEASKADPLYELHAYHQGKKAHGPIIRYIEHYTAPGDLVLDPFMGSGGTCLAALLSGRSAIGIDRSPAATFIASNYCTPCDVASLTDAFDRVLRETKAAVGWVYRTKSGRGHDAEIIYQLWSQQFECPRCLTDVAVFDAPKEKFARSDKKSSEHLVCPNCKQKGVLEAIDRKPARKGTIPVATSYESSSERPKRRFRTYVDDDRQERAAFQSSDLPLIEQCNQTKPTYFVPRHKMLNSRSRQWGFLWRPYHDDIQNVSDFFSARNNLVLGAFAHFAQKSGGEHAGRLLFLMTSVLWHASKMSQFKQGGGGIMPGLYYVPPVFKEQNVLRLLERKFRDFKRAYSAMAPRSTQLLLSTQSATHLSQIPSHTIDYIFTDPPYAEKVQYGEANHLWESWLGLDTHWRAEEIIINPVLGRDEMFWREQMSLAVKECFRVLKPGRWMTLCYHDTSEGTWAALQDLVAEAGFVPSHASSAVYIDAKQKSPKQYTSAKSTQRDLIINFRKPKVGEFNATRLVIPEQADAQTFHELARQVIQEYLQTSPGSTKDRVYDELVSRMVRRGQMEAHNFEELLQEVAEEVAPPDGSASRWYLKETEEAQLDASEQRAEDAAAAIIEHCITQAVDRTGDLGVHYSELFEHYLYAVKDKPRRALADWLTDYFYKTQDGTWRLPSGDEEREIKAKSRASGVNRRIRRFANMLEAGVTIPAEKIPSSATLAEWIRHTKRAGLYEAGKLLYERGSLDLDKLSETMQAEVEEDYQTCVRALQRAAGADVDAKKRVRRKKAGNNE
jgi:hypothetical protein